MDEFWLNKAHQYIDEHAAFSGVSDIVLSADNASAAIHATADIGLPASYLEKGETPQGVRQREPATFVFPVDFPLSAPIIVLRDDFPRGFPHINPSEKQVIPCIYDGTLSELLQQSEWMNGILNQLVEWLEKAASNALLDYSQGWEPMRNDAPGGFMSYDMDEAVAQLNGSQRVELTMRYEERNGIIVTGDLCSSGKAKPCHAAFCAPRDQKPVDRYIPNPVTTLSELYAYADSMGIEDLRDYCEIVDKKHRQEDKLLVVLALPRPCTIIGSHTNIEFLHFCIHKPKRKKNKKRIVPDSEVTMLSHIAPNTPALMKRLSGSKQALDNSKSIALVGCGSLGSKVGMHLVRNGVGPFLCIDNDVFLPHNNARHALHLPFILNKGELLAAAMRQVAQVDAIPANQSALSVDYSDSRLIIDSSASLRVRTFLMCAAQMPPIASVCLYDSGKSGLLLVENKQRDVRLSDLWAHVYRMALEDDAIHNALFQQQKERIAIGQSCSSYTLVVSDAQISLFSASFSLRIQKAIEEGMPKKGEVHFGSLGEGGALSMSVSNVHAYLDVKSATPKNWKVRLSSQVLEQMKQQAEEKCPNETGGVLLGTVFMNAKTIVVTDILPPPPDSKETPTLFILGIEGLEEQIKRIERRTCGKVTYLGTWHSHPGGGDASDTDRNTSERLLFVRNYEPTVCLVWTPDGVCEV